MIGSENKYNGYLKIDELTFKNRRGQQVKREVMRRQDAVSALVFDTKTQKYIFVSQWRPGASSELLEIAAGVLDHQGEDPRETIKREIEEEIGYKTDTLKLIEEGWVSPGGTTESISIYFAEVSEKISKGGGLEEEGEDIDIIEMDREEMLSTRFKDFKTIIAVQWAKWNHKL